jgi:hypothetical protein
MKPRSSSSVSHSVHRKYQPAAAPLLSNQPDEPQAEPQGDGLEEDVALNGMDEQQQILAKSLSIAGIKLGDIVWAKYSSYPWWPAQITHATEVSRCLKQPSIEKEGMVWTYNFGSKDFSQVRAVHVRLFSVGLQPQEPQALKKHGIKHLYEKAVREAEAADRQRTKQHSPQAVHVVQDVVGLQQKRCGRCKNCLCPTTNEPCLTFTEQLCEDSVDDQVDDTPLSPSTVSEQDLPAVLHQEDGNVAHTPDDDALTQGAS